MPDVIPQTETILKSYFETGDQPKANEFREFIGTMFYLFTQSIAASDAANVNATDALNRAPKAFLKRVGGVNLGALNIASFVQSGTGNANVTITWTTPFLNADYKVSITMIEQAATNMGVIPVITSQTTTGIVFERRPINGTTLIPADFHLIAFA